MEKASGKALNVHALNIINNSMKEKHPQSKIVFHTAYGFITGDVDSPSGDTDFDTYMQKAEQDGINDYNFVRLIKKKIIEENNYELIDDSSFISLKNVKIYHTDFRKPAMSHKMFLLHCADIIGMSISSEGL